MYWFNTDCKNDGQQRSSQIPKRKPLDALCTLAPPLPRHNMGEVKNKFHLKFIFSQLFFFGILAILFPLRLFNCSFFFGEIKMGWSVTTDSMEGGSSPRSPHWQTAVVRIFWLHFFTAGGSEVLIFVWVVYMCTETYWTVLQYVQWRYWPASGHHQLHLDFVWHDDAEDLLIGSVS